MKAITFFTLCLVLSIASIISQPGWAQTLVLSLPDGSTAAQLALQQDPESKKHSFQFVLENKSDTDIKKFEIATVISAKQGVDLTGVNGEFKNSLNNEAVTAIAKGHKTFITYTLNNPSNIDPLYVDVYLEGQDPLIYKEKLVSLLIAKPKLTNVDILESADQKMITLQTSGRDFNFPLTIVAEQGKSGRVTLITEGLFQKDGKEGHAPGKLSCYTGSGSACILNFKPGDKPQTVYLRGNLPERATYNAVLNVVFNEQYKPYRLSITRLALADSLKLSVSKPMPSSILFPNPFSKCSPDAYVTFSVSNEASRKVNIYTPRLATFELAESSKDLTQMGRPTWKILKCNSGGEEKNDVISLQENSLVNCVLQINNLGAGSYKGKMTVSGPDTKRKDVEFTLNVKHGFLLPMVIIALGVWLSYLLQQWTGAVRERDRRAYLIALEQKVIDSRLEKDSTDGVWKHLGAALAQLRRNNRYQLIQVADIGTRLTALSKQRQDYDAVLEINAQIQSLFANDPEKKRSHETNWNNLFEGLKVVLKHGSSEEIEEEKKVLEAKAKSIQEEEQAPEGARGLAPRTHIGEDDKKDTDLSPDQLLKQMVDNDRKAIIIAGLIATLSGLLAIWANEATFGSIVNYIQAFIWGFGVTEALKGYKKIATHLGVTSA